MVAVKVQIKKSGRGIFATLVGKQIGESLIFSFGGRVLMVRDAPVGIQDTLQLGSLYRLIFSDCSVEEIEKETSKGRGHSTFMSARLVSLVDVAHDIELLKKTK